MKVFLTIVLLAVAGLAQAANEIDAKVEAAMADEARPDRDRERDRNRRASCGAMRVRRLRRCHREGRADGRGIRRID